MLLDRGPRKTNLRWVLLAIPLSLLVHAVLVALFLGYSQLTAGPPRPKKPVNRPVALRRIDSKAWASNRGRASSTPLERPAPLHPQGQVVDVAPGNNQVSPDAKYLAMTDNRVKKETRAREQTNRYSRATPTTQAQPELQPSAKGKPAPVAPPPSGINLAESMLGRQAPKDPLLLPQKVAGASTEVQEAPAVPGSEAGTPGLPGDATSEGGGAPNDDLDALEAGAGTFLNTREWKYAAFFNRVKQAVSGRWDPNGRLRAKNRTIGMADRLTVLHVTLRPDGSLADVQVAQSCGLDELDVEAMNAFTKAQPFSNPPAALVEDGYIRFGFSFRVSNEGMAMPLPFQFR